MTILTYPDLATWEASRRTPGAHYIGASEIAQIILGCGPVASREGAPSWCDAFDLWRSHQPDAVPEHRAEMADGTAWEPLALRLYDPPPGLRLVVSPLSVAVHPCGWLRATPDAWLVDADLSVFPDGSEVWHPRGLTEIKTDRHRNALDVWTATEIREFVDGQPIGMPGHYWLQVQAQLACTLAPWCDVVAWIPQFAAMPVQRRVRVFPSVRWPAIFAAVDSWRARHLVGGEPPEAWTAEQIEHAQRLAYPNPRASRHAAGDEAAAIRDWLDALDERKALDAVIENSKVILAKARGDHKEIHAPNIGTYHVYAKRVGVTRWSA